MKRVVIAVALRAVVAWPRPGWAGTEFEAAEQACADYDYAGALAHFRAAAVPGKVRAERIIGLTVLYGDQLYGPGVQRDRAEAIGWLTAAAAHGDAVAGYLLRRLTAEDKPPQGPLVADLHD